MVERDFARFEFRMSFRPISHIAQHTCCVSHVNVACMVQRLLDFVKRWISSTRTLIKNISEFLICIINYCEDSRIVVTVSNQLCVYISFEIGPWFSPCSICNGFLLKRIRYTVQPLTGDMLAISENYPSKGNFIWTCPGCNICDRCSCIWITCYTSCLDRDELHFVLHNQQAIFLTKV